VLFLAGALIAIQALVAAGFGLFELSQIRANRVVVGAGTAIIMLGYATFLIAVARGVWRVRRWSRGAAVATQLLNGLIAWSFKDGQTWWVALSLGGAAFVALVCLLLPSSTSVFVKEFPDDR
jgi:hypothetical protein